MEAQASSPRWFVPAGIAFLALAVLLSVLAVPFMALALVPFVLGVLLANRGRVGIGIAMSAMAVVVPLAGHILLVNLLVTPYEIPSEAMRPTLQVGDRILVDRTGLDGVDVGDIVVFHPPAGADSGTQCGVPHGPKEACPHPTAAESSQSFVKRIIAGPGDTLAVHNGHPVVNEVEKSDEPYIRPCGTVSVCNLPKAITVPPGHYFMMGDNRGESDDSRFWGPVPRSWIIGVVFARYAPLGSASIF